MQRVFRVVETRELTPVGPKTSNQFNRSIRRNGIVNPVLLAEVVDANGVIDLVIIDGNRRIKAAQIARLPKAPAVVLKATTEKDRAHFTLMCNYMRSANFHTESAAIMALAANENAAAGAARAIGVGPAKMQQLYRKIATMPEPVRRAMHEHRIPVTAATWVGAWPEGLQRELIELLDRRRYVNTTMVKDLREWYAERHPEEFGIVEQPEEHVSFDEWGSTELHVLHIPVPPDGPEDDPLREDHGAAPTTSGRDSILATSPDPEPVSAIVAGVPVPTLSDLKRVPAEFVAPESMRPLDDGPAGTIPRSWPVATPASSLPPAAANTEPLQPTTVTLLPTGVAPLQDTSKASGELVATAATSRESDPEPFVLPHGGTPSQALADDRAEQLVAFVVRLDAKLRDLAREGHALGVSRSVWVDRTMRAWDRIEG
jgi:ParB/RepB/Spo0J family partition protein